MKTQRWKKILSMVLALTMVFSMLPMNVFAAELGEDENGTNETTVEEVITGETPTEDEKKEETGEVPTSTEEESKEEPQTVEESKEEPQTVEESKEETQSEEESKEETQSEEESKEETQSEEEPKEEPQSEEEHETVEKEVPTIEVSDLEELKAKLQLLEMPVLFAAAPVQTEGLDQAEVEDKQLKANLTLTENATLGENDELTIPEDISLTIAEGKVLSVYGKLVNNGVINGAVEILTEVYNVGDPVVYEDSASFQKRATRRGVYVSSSEVVPENISWYISIEGILNKTKDPNNGKTVIYSSAPDDDYIESNGTEKTQFFTDVYCFSEFRNRFDVTNINLYLLQDVCDINSDLIRNKSEDRIFRSGASNRNIFFDGCGNELNVKKAGSLFKTGGGGSTTSVSMSIRNLKISGTATNLIDVVPQKPSSSTVSGKYVTLFNVNADGAYYSTITCNGQSSGVTNGLVKVYDSVIDRIDYSVQSNDNWNISFYGDNTLFKGTISSSKGKTETAYGGMFSGNPTNILAAGKNARVNLNDAGTSVVNYTVIDDNGLTTGLYTKSPVSIADGYRSAGTKKIGTTTYYVVEKIPPVVSVEVNGVVTEYVSMETALTALEAGSFVKLLADSEDDIVLPVGAVLDTNGFAYTGKVTPADTAVSKIVEAEGVYSCQELCAATVGTDVYHSLEEAVAAVKDSETAVVVKLGEDHNNAAFELGANVSLNTSGVAYTGKVSAPAGYHVENTNGVLSVAANTSVSEQNKVTVRGDNDQPVTPNEAQTAAVNAVAQAAQALNAAQDTKKEINVNGNTVTVTKIEESTTKLGLTVEGGNTQTQTEDQSAQALVSLTIILDTLKAQSNDGAVAQSINAATTEDDVKELDEDVDKYLIVDMTATKVETVTAATQEEQTVTSVRSATFDVTPKATITKTVTDEEGNVSVETVTVTIPNEAIMAPITFRLPVEASAPFTKAKVYHEEEYLGEFAVEGTTEGGRYIEVSSMEFSKFTYEGLTKDTNVQEDVPQAQLVAVVMHDDEYTPYADLQTAVSAAQNGDIVVLQKDVELSKTINTPKSITFTFDFNGKTLSIGNTLYDPALSVNAPVTLTAYNGGGIGTDKAATDNLFTGNGNLTIQSGTYMGYIGKTSNVSISGGSFSNQPAASCIATGYEAVKSGDLWVVQAKQPVASVDGVKYLTMQLAIKAATTNEKVVKLLRDVTVDNHDDYVSIQDNDVTIDLNGHNITSADTYTIYVAGKKLSLVNTSTTRAIVKNTYDGAGEYQAIRLADAQASVYVGKNVDIEIKPIRESSYAINGASGSAVLESDKGLYSGKINVNSLAVTGGTFNGAISANVATISGGVFQQAVNVRDNAAVSGGTFKSTVSLGAGSTITGGTFDGTVTTPEKSISGGKFKSMIGGNESKFLVDTKCWTAVDDEGYYSVVDAVAQVGTTRYATFAEAMTARNGNTDTEIKLLANVEYTLALGDSLNINANGKSFTPSAPTGFEVVNTEGVYTLKMLPITVTVQENRATHTYDGATATLTASFEGENNTPDGVTYQWYKGTTAIGGATVATYAVGANVSDSGDYKVVATVQGYSSTSEAVTVTINMANYDMSGVTFTDASKPYTGVVQNLEVSGTLPTGADNVPVTVTYSEGLTNVGEKVITATFATESGNYNAPEAKTAKLTITKVDATITPNDASKIAGNKDPELTAEVTGTVNNETLAYTVSRTEGDTAGEYTISVEVNDTAAVNKNYNIDASATAKFTITDSAAKVKHGDVETYYNTLDAAYNAAEDGDTLTLLVNTDTFPKIEKGITVDFGDKVVNSKVTVDAANKTVTFKGTTGGIQPTSGNAISVKNGGLVIDSGVYTSTNASLIVDEYGTKSLTVNGGTLTANFGTDYTNSWARFIYDFDGNVTLNGGNLTFNVENPSTYYAYFIEIDGNENTVEVNNGANVTINSKDRATFVCGDSPDVNINGGTITSNGASRNTLVDDGKNVKIENVNYTATGTVTNYIIDGAEKTEVSGGTFDITPNYDTWGKPIEVFGCADTAVSGGTYTVPVSPEKCAEGFAPETHVDEQTGKVTYGVDESPEPIVAKITDSNKVVNYYTSLEKAIEAVTNDKVIELTADIVLDKTLDVNKYVKIESRAHNVSTTVSNQKLFKITNNGTLYIDANYGTPNSTFTGRFDVGAAPNDNGNLILYYGNYTVDNNTVIHVNGTCDNCKLQIVGAKVTSNGDNAIQMNGGGTLRIASSTVTGATGVYMKAGTLNFESGTIKGNGDYKDTVVNHNGSDATGDAIVLDAQDGYNGQINVNIDKTSSAKIESTNGSAIREAVTEGNNSATVSLVISNPRATLTGAEGKPAIQVTDEFIAAIKAGTATSKISAGTYSSAVPAELCADGYIPTSTGGSYTVTTGLLGSGTAHDPWQIRSKADLEYLRSAVESLDPNKFWITGTPTDSENRFVGKHFKLMNDIDLGGETWTPIGSSTDHSFAASFDGNGKKISNLKVETESAYAGLFGVLTYISEAPQTFKNLTIENASVKGASDVGAIAGYGGCAKFENCHVTGTVKIEASGDNVGGITGGTYTSNTNCSVVATADSENYIKSTNGANVGGIAGVNLGEGTYPVTDCSVSNISISGESSVGGILGTANGNSASVTGNSVTNATINGTADVSGEVYGSTTGLIVGGNNGSTGQMTRIYNNTVSGTTATAADKTVTHLTGTNAELTLVGTGITFDESGKKISGGDIEFIGTAGTAYDTICGMLASGNALQPQADGTYNVKPAVASIGTMNYATLAEAFAAAQSGATVKLLNNAELDAYVVVDKQITLDLNGKEITYTGTTNCNGGIIRVEHGGDLTVDDSSEAKNGAIKSGDKAYAAVQMTVDKNDTADTNAAKLTVNAGTLEGKYYGISGNGSEGRGNTEVTINGGTVKGTTVNDSVGIYNPQSGTLTIKGGTVEGAVGVYVKAGTVSVVDGGTVKGTGAKADFVHNGNGVNNTGDAFIVENCGYPGGVPGVTISGGTFTSTYGSAVASYAYGNDASDKANKPIGGFISGGSFSSKVPLEYCTEGFRPAEKGGDNMYTVTSGAAVASITTDGNTVYYATLADAIAAVPTSGTATTITMIANETISGNTGVTVAANQNIVLDLNGKTISNAVNEDKGSQVITNKGTLTIQDSSNPSTGKITNAVKEGTQAGEWWSTPQYNYATNVITNTGTLTIKGGEIYETAAGSICYAIDNNSSDGNAILNVEGGNIHKDSGTAVRAFANSTTNENKINVSDGKIAGGYAGIWIQLPGSSGQQKKIALNVTGGEIKGEYAFYDYTYGDKFENSAYNISGGTFDGAVFSYGANIEITNGKFTDDVSIYAKDNNEVSVSGGSFTTFNKDIDNPADAAKNFISGGTFSSKPDESFFADNFAPVPNGEGTYGVGTCVATVKRNNVVYNYNTLDGAVEAATVSDDVVTLLANTSSEGFTVNTGVTLNLNNFTVAQADGFTGIINSGTIKLYEENAAQLGYLLYDVGGSYAAAEGFTYTKGSENYVIPANATVSASAEEGKQVLTINVPAEGNALTWNADVKTGYVLNVTGKVAAETLTVKEGALINSGDYTAVTTLTAGNGTIAGGTFKRRITNAELAQGKVCTKSGNNYVVNNGEFVAQIVGGEQYATLNEAVAAAQNNDTIMILCNITEDTEIVPVCKTITLDTQVEGGVTINLVDATKQTHQVYAYFGPEYKYNQNKIIIKEGVNLENVNAVMGYYNDIEINSVVKSYQAWPYGGTITVNPTGRLELGYGDGTILLGYGGKVNVNGTLAEGTAATADYSTLTPSLTGYVSGGYGGGKYLNFDNAYASFAYIPITNGNLYMTLDNSVVTVATSYNGKSLCTPENTSRVTLEGGSRIIADKVEFGSKTTLSISDGSTVTAPVFTNAGTINVDMTNVAAGYKVIDYTGTGTPDYGTVNVNGDYEAKIVNNDLYVVKKNTLFVDDDWANKTAGKEIEAGMIFGTNAFATIQAAVNEANVSGGAVTIHVKAGTYAETVTLTGNNLMFTDGDTDWYGRLNFVGENGATITGGFTTGNGTPNNVADLSFSGFTFTDEDYPIYIDNSGAKSKNITISGNTFSDGYIGPYVISATVDKLTVTDNNFASTTGYNATLGGADASVINNLTVSGNTFANELGIFGSIGESGAIVSGNTFTGNEYDAIWFNNSFADNTGTLTVSGNTIAGTYSYPIAFRNSFTEKSDIIIGTGNTYGGNTITAWAETANDKFLVSAGADDESAQYYDHLLYLGDETSFKSAKAAYDAATDNGTLVFLNGEAPDEVLKSSIDMSTVYVDSELAGTKQGTRVVKGDKTFYFGINAFDVAPVVDANFCVLHNGTPILYTDNFATALAYTVSGDTIQLLKDASGEGLFIEKTQDNLTLDLNGKTYTVTSPAVGSAGTESQALHIEAPSFKLMGGTLTSEGTEVKMLVQNYSNLTVENVTLDGSKLPGNKRYVLSNNSGNVTVTGSTITAKSGDFAMDSCKFGSYNAPDVTVTGSILNGKVELSGGDVVLGSGAVVNGQVRVGENKDGGATGSVLDIQSGATVNGTIAVFGANTVDVAGNVNGYIATNGNAYNAGSTINVKVGANIVGEYDVAMYIPNGTLNISGGEIKVKDSVKVGTAVYVKAGTLNITGGTLTGKGSAEYSFNGNGANGTGNALVIDSCNYPSAFGTVSVTGGTFQSDNGVDAVKSYTYNDGDPVTNFISGGSFSSQVPLEYCAAGYMPSQKNDQGMYSVEHADAVAVVTGANKDPVYYTDFDAALSAADNGDTLTLLSNITLQPKWDGTGSVTFTDVRDARFISKNITIDGDGHSITWGSDHYCDNNIYRGMFTYNATGGTITLKNLTVDANNAVIWTNGNKSVYSHKLGIICSTGSNLSNLVIDNCEFKNCFTAVEAKNGLTVTNSKFTNCARGGIIDDNAASGKEWTVTGNEFTNCGNESNGAIVQAWTPITFSENKVNGGNVTLYLDETHTMSKNTFTASDTASNILTIYGKDASTTDKYFLSEEKGYTYRFVAEGGIKLDMTGATLGEANDKQTSFQVEYTEGSSSVTLPTGYVPFFNQYVKHYKDGNLTYTSTICDIDKAELAVAKIGSFYFKSVNDAIAAVKSDDTIELLQNCAVTGENMLVVDKSITLDLNGKTLTGIGKTFEIVSGATLTVDGTDEGSTMSNVRFNVGKANNDNGNLVLNGGSYSIDNNTVVHVNGTCGDSDVTITNATITANGDNGIQLNGKGTHRITNSTITGATAVYVKASEVTITGSTITGNGTKVAYSDNQNGATATGDAIVVDSCNYPAGTPEVKLTGTNNISSTNGKQIGVYQSHEGAVPDVTSSDKTLTLPDGYAWNSEGKVVKAEAKIGTTYYATVEEAIAVGGTVDLLLDSTIEEIVISNKTVNLNLNGKTLTGTAGKRVKLFNGANLTVNGTNSTITGVRFNVGNDTNNAAENASLTLNGGTYTIANNTVVHVDGDSTNSAVTITGATITSTGDNGIQLSGGGTYRITDSEITGATAVYIKAGTLNVSGSKLTGNKTPANYSYSGNGANATGDAIVIDSCGYPGGAPIVNIGEDNTISGTKKDVGVYQYNDNELPNVTSSDKSLSLPDGYAWNAQGKVVKAEAKVVSGETTVYYDTLANAVAAAQSGDTVTLVANASGDGIALWKGDNKSITINLNNHTYTVDGELVGSSGTKSQAFHFEEGNTVTIKNGTLTSATARMLMQNYANLTLDGVTLNGTQMLGTGRYVLSNNSGTVQVKDSTITAKSGDFAFDTCKFGTYSVPSVEVNGNSVITGNVELSGGNLALNAGTLDGTLVNGGIGTGSITKADGFTAAAPTGYSWTKINGVDTLVPSVAMIGDVAYGTLADAIEEASSGATVTLLSNIELTAQQLINKNINLDLNGKTVEYKGSATLKSGVFGVKPGATLTINDSSSPSTGAIKSGENAYAAVAVTVKDDVTNESSKACVVVNAGTLEGYYYGITGSGNETRKYTEITVNGGTVKGTKANDSTGIFNPNGVLTISGGTIEGATGVYVKAGNVSVVNGGTIKGTGTKAAYQTTGDGFKSTGDGLVIDNAGYPGGVPTASITGGTFESTNGSAVASYAKTGLEPVANFISGGYYSKPVPAELIVNGYKCIKTPDTDPNKDNYHYMVVVAPTKVEADEDVAEFKTGDGDEIVGDVTQDQAAAEKQKVVEDILDNAAETSYSNIQDVIDEKKFEKIKGKDTTTSQFETIYLNENTDTRIDVKLESVKIEVQKPTEALQTTTNSVVYDVKPIVTVTKTEGGVTTVKEYVITNDWLEDKGITLTFTLAVPTSLSGNTVKVTHKPSEGDETSWTAEVKDSGENRYIEIEAKEFSEYELSVLDATTSVARIDTDDAKTYYYNSVSDAIKDAEATDVIYLLQNQIESITIPDNKTITLNLNGYTLTAETITAVTNYGKLTICDSTGGWIKSSLFAIDDETTDSGMGTTIVSGNVDGLIITANNNVEIKEGSFDNEVEWDWLSDQSVVTYADNRWNVKNDPTIIAKVGTEKFRKVQLAAIEAAKNNGTVVLVGDTTADALVVNTGWNVTLDLNGHTLGGTVTVTNKGTLTILDSKPEGGGTVNGSTRAVTTTSGITYIKSGNFIGSVTKSGSGKYAISGGIFDAKVQQVDCEIGYKPKTISSTKYTVVEEAFDVVLFTRVFDGTNYVDISINATLTGGGEYAYDDEAIVTANSVNGNVFVGWYKADANGNVLNPLTVQSYEYSFNVREDTYLAAIYKGRDGAKFDLIVSASKYMIDGETKYGYVLTPDIPVNTQKTITWLAPDDNSETFLYWANAFGAIVSTNKEYKVPVNADTQIYAVTSKDNVAGVTVVYTNGTGQILSADFYELEESATSITLKQSPSEPPRLGYRFVGWFIVGTDDEASNDNIYSYLRPTEGSKESSVVIEPHWETLGSAVEVTIIKQDKETTNSESSIRYITSGVSTTITADESFNSKRFAYWEKDGKPISYNRAYVLKTTVNTTLKAVYSSETVTAAPCIDLVQLTASIDRVNEGKYVVVPVVSYYVPEGYTVVDIGILRGAKADLDFETSTATLFIGNTSTTQQVWSSGMTTLTGTFTRDVTNSSPTNYREFCGYLQVMNESGETETYYSQIMGGTVLDIYNGNLTTYNAKRG